MTTGLESRVKQCEVIVARADQIIERLTKLRGEVMLQTLLRRDVSPLSRDVWDKLGPQFRASLQAISDVLDDMSSGKPMDRLICGDVGFGKTEVALRAAFVAAMSRTSCLGAFDGSARTWTSRTKRARSGGSFPGSIRPATS